MPKFTPQKLTTAALPDGVYLTKVLTAEERTAETGNPMLKMKLGLLDGRQLPCVLNFTDKARTVLTAFCTSAGLILPTDGSEVDLTATDVIGRYLYIVIVNDITDAASDPVPRIVRYLTRESALIKNPALAEIVINPQPPRQLTLPAS